VNQNAWAVPGVEWVFRLVRGKGFYTSTPHKTRILHAHYIDDSGAKVKVPVMGRLEVLCKLSKHVSEKGKMGAPKGVAIDRYRLVVFPRPDKDYDLVITSEITR